MAIAKAECTCLTCGKKFEVRTYKYNGREADSFEKWAVENITECDDCAKARRDAAHAAENEAAAQSAKENAYPDLSGTERQVAWANTIREKVITTLHEYCSDEDHLRRAPQLRYLEEAYIRLLLKKTRASWWIDHRGSSEDIRGLTQIICREDEDEYRRIAEIAEAVKKGSITLAEAMAEFIRKPEQPEEKPVRPEAVPEERKHAGSVDIRISDGKVVAMYEKNDAFREIVKSLNFSWSDGWIRTPGEMAGTAENIIAELGSRLLNKGFAVRFDTRDLLDKAVRGDYQPMCMRWIRTSPDGFGIVWGGGDDLYREAKSLPGAAYRMGMVIVPERSWNAILDFADRYGFRITVKAQEKLDALSGASMPVSPAPVQEMEYNESNVLESSREVLPDLRDD